MQITKRIRLDFARALSPIYVFAKQGDVDSRYVEVEPLENGKAYTIPAGVTAAFACQKPDGHQVLIDGATSESGYPKIDYENNLIILELTDQTLAAAGDAIATAILKDSITNKVLSTQNFILKIERSALDGGSVESSDEYQGYIAALNLIDEALKKSEDTVKEEEKRAESELERQLNEETRQEAEKERVETFAGWKEQIDGITADNAENRQNIAEMMPQITSNTQGITQNSQLIIRNSARLTNVEQRISPSPFVTDSTVAYVKDVPANALPYAELQKLGGMTYRVNLGTDDAPNYVLRSAPVTSVESVGANLLNMSKFSGGSKLINTDGSVSIKSGNSAIYPSAILTGLLPSGTYNLTNISGNSCYVMSSTSDYSNLVGIVQNKSFTYDGSSYLEIRYLEQSANTTVTYKAMLNKGTTALPYAPYTKSTLAIPEAVRPANGINDTVYDFIELVDEKGAVTNTKAGETVVLDGTETWEFGNNRFKTYLGKQAMPYTTPCLSNKYDYKANVYYDTATDTGVIANNDSIYIRDMNYATLESWKAYLAEQYAAGTPVTVVYALATPEVTDISALITADNMLPVQGNGTITFVNEYGYAVPSTVEYMT